MRGFASTDALPPSLFCSFWILPIDVREFEGYNLFREPVTDPGCNIIPSRSLPFLMLSAILLIMFSRISFVFSNLFILIFNRYISVSLLLI